MSVLRSLTSSLNSPFASMRSTGRRAWVLSATPVFYRRSAALAVAALAVGIVSGGAVRLTGSGLGCRDWPGCTETSIVAPLQYHAWIEFGNRLVNVLITVAVVLLAIAAFRRRPRRRDLVALSGGLVAGIFAEVVLGGETVLHKLAPTFVMAHFVLAMVLLVNAVVLYHRARQPEGEDVVGPPKGSANLLPARRLVRPSHVVASRCMLGLTAVVVVLGTVVTSTGPHAGAPGVRRFGFSLHTVAQLHGTSVEVLLAVTVATLWSMHRSRVAPAVIAQGRSTARGARFPGGRRLHPVPDRGPGAARQRAHCRGHHRRDRDGGFQPRALYARACAQGANCKRGAGERPSAGQDLEPGSRRGVGHGFCCAG